MIDTCYLGQQENRKVAMKPNTHCKAGDRPHSGSQPEFTVVCSLLVNSHCMYLCTSMQHSLMYKIYVDSQRKLKEEKYDDGPRIQCTHIDHTGKGLAPHEDTKLRHA